VCTHIFSQAFLVGSTSDCDSAESHVPRKLDTKMPKAANALLGDRQRAVDWLQRAVALGDVNYPWFKRDKNYDSLRADPEYQTIMAGVRQRWEAYKNEFDVAR